jgi:hypothetical protein
MRTESAGILLLLIVACRCGALLSQSTNGSLTDQVSDSSNAVGRRHDLASCCAAPPTGTMTALSIRTHAAVGALIVLLLAVPAGAQVIGATLTGTVVDPRGAAALDATVTIRNVETGIVTVTQTNAAGNYSLPNLLPGEYTISVEASGLTSVELSRRRLAVGETQIVNIQMRMANFTENVDVVALAATVEFGSAAVRHVVDGRAIRDLPLNGRDWTQLALLEPGISLIRTQPTGNGVNNRGNRGFGSQLTIAGARPQQNSYRIDGISVNDYANSSPGTTDGLNLGAEAIAQLLVVSSNYSASYGLTSGGVISAMIRAGANDFHGSAYEFLRNDAFDARGYFDDAKLPFRRNQFGFAAGGPIVKNRTFFFANYERRRESLTTTGIATVPSQAARSGHLASGDITVDPSVQRYLGLFALPNGSVVGDTGLYTFPSTAVVPEHLFTGRVDHVISTRDNVHGTYLFDTGSTTQPDSLNVVLNFNKATRQVGAIEATHIFGSQFVNTVRVGVNRVVAATLETAPGANPLGSDPSLGIAPGLYAPVVQVTGLTNFGGGLNGTSFGNYWFTTWQMYDDAFWSVGKHSIKVGFAFERIYSDFLLAANPNGVFRFNTLGDFLVNRPASAQLQYGPLTPRALRQNVFGVYVEDDYRPIGNLSVNLGLRYEPASVPTEVNGRLANLRTLGSAQIYAGDPLFRNPTLANLEPRVGMAWDPFKTGKTAVRAGFGIFDVLPLTHQFNLMQVSAAPFQATASSSSLPAGSFPSGAISLVKLGTALRTSFIEFEPKRNYVMQWNASAEREVLHALTVMAGYVGSRGVHNAMRTTDANGVMPSMTPDGLVWPCAGVVTDGVCNRPGGGARFNAAYGQIDGQVWNGSSSYHAFLLSATRRFVKGFTAQLSFTWSDSKDTGSSVGSGGPFLNSVSGQFLFAPIRARSDFNVSRTLIGSGTWEVPFGRAKSWGGWQVSGILNISDGLPFTPLISGDALGQANQSLFDLPDRLDQPGCESAVNPGNPSQYIKLSCFAFPFPSTRFGNAGRNSLIGPGLVTVDASLIKDIALDGLGQGAHVQVRAELFNVANRANFAAPLANNRLFDAKGAPVSFAGRITTLSTSPRQLQLGVKLIW